ncbi:MAG: hypothetical protein F4X40_05340 [Chloroflexi bacterium]|nr:hypothetical protein [Chloroflexota bacterium]
MPPPRIWLIERIVLTSGEKRDETHAALQGDLGTILEWAGSGSQKKKRPTPRITEGRSRR